MRAEQLEAWVLRLVDTVLNGQRVEDSRVELKAAWPDPKVAARRIAGHANASATDHILWVVGLDEIKGIVPYEAIELADWWQQVTAEFDGLAPTFQDIVVPTSKGALVALLLAASRRPFVVKNTRFGLKDGGPVSLEVPWRRGTAIHTARREDLIRLLVPLATLPNVELLEASASLDQSAAIGRNYGPIAAVREKPHLTWAFHLVLFVTPRSPELLVLPNHKALVRFTPGNGAEVIAGELNFTARSQDLGGGRVRQSSTVSAAPGEAAFTGPGTVKLSAHRYEEIRPIPEGDLRGTLVISPAGSDASIEIEIPLRKRTSSSETKLRWELDDKGDAKV